MRFRLVLEKTGRSNLLPINYQYPLSACIYKIIQTADEAFSRFLHEGGYAVGHKKLKLFTFSPLKIYPYNLLKDYQRLEMKGDYAELEIRFLIDEAAESFIKGLFLDQEMSVRDRIGGVDFTVARIEALAPPVFAETMSYKALSPICISIQPDRQKPCKYLSPEDPGYIDQLINNLTVKLTGYAFAGARTGERLSGEAFGFRFRPLSKPRPKLIAIKAMTAAETRVRGWLYDFQLTAPAEMQEIGYYAGFGEKNSMGFGCVEAVFS